MVTTTLERAVSQDRHNLLHPTSSGNTGASDGISFITTYHPEVNRTLKKIFHDLSPLLDDDDLSNIFPTKPRVVNRQPPSIRRTLVSSNIKASTTDSRGTFACLKPRCLTCQHIINDRTISRNGAVFNITGHYNCGTSGVVYLISCARCPDAWYFGESGNPLRTRLNGHRRSIVQKNTAIPVGHHFNLPGHGIEDLKILVVRGGIHDSSTRKKTESEFIAKFSTHSGQGLNRDIGILSKFRSILT